MTRHPSSATTRSTRSIHVPIARGSLLLISGQAIESPETGLRYRIDRLLGEGGFGQAYLAKRIGRSSTVPETVCIKVSPRMDGWIREAYFGQLLEGHPRAIGIFDQFPLMRADGQVLYYLALEYAPHGDLGAFLRKSETGFSEAFVRREIAGILEVLRKLHRGQTLHRDLTPMNLFVCEGPKLKLGDFGIARQQSDTPRHHRPHHEPDDRAERPAGARGPQVAGARRRVSGGAVAGHADPRRRGGADPHRGRAQAQLQRSPEGDRPPLHRRAAQALRERRRDDRRAPQPAAGAAGRGQEDARRGCTSPSPAS